MLWVCRLVLMLLSLVLYLLLLLILLLYYHLFEAYAVLLGKQRLMMDSVC